MWQSARSLVIRPNRRPSQRSPGKQSAPSALTRKFNAFRMQLRPLSSSVAWIIAAHQRLFIRQCTFFHGPGDLGSLASANPEIWGFSRRSIPRAGSSAFTAKCIYLRGRALALDVRHTPGEYWYLRQGRCVYVAGEQLMRIRYPKPSLMAALVLCVEMGRRESKEIWLCIRYSSRSSATAPASRLRTPSATSATPRP